jgi:hypothetical protein
LAIVGRGDFGTVAPNTNIGAVGGLLIEDVTFSKNDTVKHTTAALRFSAT